MSAEYPTHRAVTAVIRDGSTVAVRRIRAEDEAELSRFFSALSLESLVSRFFGGATPDAMAQPFAQVDYRSRYGIIAIAGRGGQVVGHAMFAEVGPRKAELALAKAQTISPAVAFSPSHLPRPRGA